jgi:hypothetical protein
VIRLYKSIILNVVLFRCETWSLREEHRKRMDEKMCRRKYLDLERESKTRLEEISQD